MSTRYQQLRRCVVRLAAPSEEQVAYLDSIFRHMTVDGNATEYGNDELALEFDDIFGASRDMIDHGELSASERSALVPLDDLLQKGSGEENAEFWLRSSLANDPRWREVRRVAAEALARLPDEQRAIGRSASRPLSTHSQT